MDSLMQAAAEALVAISMQFDEGVVPKRDEEKAIQHF